MTRLPHDPEERPAGPQDATADRPLLDRRRFLAAGAAVAGAAAAAPIAEADAARKRRRKRRPRRKKPAAPPARPLPPIGSGGRPTPPAKLAELASAVGGGEALTFLDLAAFDANLAIAANVARAEGWAIRPALKSFQSPQFIAYALERLPEPRGLVFHLRAVDDILAAAPAGTDLMLGYPPSLHELERFLATPPPRKAHRCGSSSTASSCSSARRPSPRRPGGRSRSRCSSSPGSSCPGCARRRSWRPRSRSSGPSGSS